MDELREMKQRRMLRGDELLEWGEYIMGESPHVSYGLYMVLSSCVDTFPAAGGPVYPMAMFTDEGVPPPRIAPKH